MLVAVLSGLLISCLIIPFGKHLKSKWGILIALLPASLFVYFLMQLPKVQLGNILTSTNDWVPSMGVNLAFRLDGLSLLFALLITGIGTGIFCYAFSYLKKHNYIDRFFGYLSLFMASMLGLSLSDNIILLFVFWELTSISSFFLIGFNNNSSESRRSALISFGVTGLGGFFLLAALVWVGSVAGTYNLSDLLLLGNIYTQEPLYPLAVVFLCIGAFTKSAQFPFHFWLPGAMRAPTPVSAYLHSATMVKAGVYILARFTPIIGGTVVWQYLLIGFGGFTMIYAAYNSIIRNDLKSILAYTTISALGILVFLIGLGTQAALIAAISFIVTHALYKAALFMITGIIDLQTGTRNIRKLSGLFKKMPLVGVAAAVAALSSAGVPLFIGFISKDLIYESTLELLNNQAYYLTALAVLTNIALVAAGFMAGFTPFIGKDSFPKVTRFKMEPSFWLPPILLGLLTLIFGIFPSWLEHAFINPSTKVILSENITGDLKLWHGFNTVFILSLITVGVGTVLFFLNKPSQRKQEMVSKLEKIAPKSLFSRLFFNFRSFSQQYTNILHDGFLRNYIFKIFLFAEIVLLYVLIKDGPIYVNFEQLSAISFYEIVCVLILCGAILIVLFTKSRMTAVIATSVVGYTICLMYVFYSAPDLAMTQFSIDTLTVVLFVFVLFRLPPFLNFRNKATRARDAVLAILFGTTISLVVLKVMQTPFTPDVKEFYGAYAYILAKGKNVVNVILVDFRGMDTMFEIVVLTIAGLGVFSLLKLRLKSSEKE